MADFVKDIADINADFSQWYTDVVLKSQLVDYGPVKGTMVIRPYGYAVWENVQHELDKRFKATGHSNAYFPMLIPLSFLQREAEHVEGFAPEVALVTHVGETELGEKLVVRPTSETIICNMYSKWVQSYRDLPLLINQWANVVRWEKTTRPFLRTSEFLWQEGHTVHASGQEAYDEAIKMLEVYSEFCKNVLAMPVITGQKTEKEKFAGAEATFGMEAMMKDGKSLQAGTTHYFADRFAKAFEIKFLDKDGVHKYAMQSSWGVSTRLIGALIMTHGDERGLIFPPFVAPIQAVIIPIAAHKEGVQDACKDLLAKLKKAGLRTELDLRDESAGWKFNEWELKGVPLRIELGPKDLANGCVTVFRRDTLQKQQLPLKDAVKSIKGLLKDIHNNMYKTALERLNSNIKQADNLEQMREVLDGGGFAVSMWCGDRACEDQIKQQMAASARVMPFDQKPVGKTCVCCQKKAVKKVVFARAY